MKPIVKHRCFDGDLGYYEHDAHTTRCRMRFTVFVPPQAEVQLCPVLFYLSGRSCTEENFTTKAGAYRVASELGIIIVAPDTSPRGEGVADAENHELGKGASFYVNATQAPWKQHYQMESYITQELRDIVIKEFPVDAEKLGIFGHSMGGHGALTLYLRNPGLYQSVSALAPVCSPTQGPWAAKVFLHYLGNNPALWAEYDATELMKQRQNQGHQPPILIDQGTVDPFLRTSLKPELFAAACKQAGQSLTLRMHEGYDHGYFFIQSFIDDHLRHHAAILSDL